MTVSSVRVSAPAKINLYLAVSGLREDGYHDVSTVLQALEFGDELHVATADGFAFTSEPPFDIPAEANLVTRAAHELSGLLGIDPGFSFHLIKRIPAGAGLGGGSADAAAALAGMGRLLGLDPDDARLGAAAAKVGTDVPFFLTGGTALYGGRGEDLIRRLPTPGVDVVVVKPGESISTADAYAAFDTTPQAPAPGPEQLTHALQSRDPAALSAALYNNMTRAAVGLVAELEDTLAWVSTRDGVTGSMLCGSGSAIFALCRDAAGARDVAEQARARGMWSVSTRTSTNGVTIRVEECA